ncbi:MAG: putative glycosyltransferase [Pseudonocardiales bacterium]|nr:putative glycosyltransferase [Pseudonocardiales bacterium]
MKNPTKSERHRRYERRLRSESCDWSRIPASGDGGEDVSDIAVVVVTYSPGEMLATFLDSLPGALTRPYEVILADNGSSDGAPAIAAQRVGVRLVPTGGNLGFGKAANVGVAASTSEFVLIANPDVELGPRSIDLLLAAFDRWPRAAAVGPLICTPGGEIYPSARELPSLGRGIGHALAGWWWPNNPWTRAYRQERGKPAEATTGWLSGSCLLVRRDAFDSVGGFDPAYFMYFEDTDLGARLGRAGWLNVYVPSATITHFGGHSTSKEPLRMMREHHRSAYRYLSRQYPGLRWAPVRALLRVGLAARVGLARLVPAVAAGARPGRRGSASSAATDKGEIQ